MRSKVIKDVKEGKINDQLFKKYTEKNFLNFYKVIVILDLFIVENFMKK